MNKQQVLDELVKITGRSPDEFFTEDESNVRGLEDCHPNVESIVVISTNDRPSTLECDNNNVIRGDLSIRYNGVMVGKFVLDNKIQMTRKDFFKTSKNLTHDEIMNHPLLYVMFRSEGQMEPNFIRWMEGFK